VIWYRGDKFECWLPLQGRTVGDSISGFLEILLMNNKLYGNASRYTVILKFPSHLKCFKFGRTEISDYGVLLQLFATHVTSVR